MTNAINNQISEKNSRMIAMMGTTPDHIEQAVERAWDSEKSFNDKDKRTVATDMAMSMLSDAQELLESDPVFANKLINRAKWVLMEFVSVDNR